MLAYENVHSLLQCVNGRYFIGFDILCIVYRQVLKWNVREQYKCNNKNYYSLYKQPKKRKKK